TAIKAARRWGHEVKGIPDGRAEIVVAEGNFHGRTTTIIGFSSEPGYQRGFGPFAPGFRLVPFGDFDALAAAIGPDTCAVLVEPIQGEAGVIVPPDGWLAAARRLCDERNVLLILDEVQSGLGRTGRWFAFEHEGIRPDGLILGKALGGGVLPVSAFLADAEVMDVFTPGSHGSTFGGNPLAAAVGLEALRVLEDEELVERSAALGEHLLARLRRLRDRSSAVREVRGRGLWAAVEFDPDRADARAVAERLAGRGVLSKETHDTVLRIAPPLVIRREELDWGLDRLEEVLAESDDRRAAVTIAVPAPNEEEGRAAEPAPDAVLLLCPPDHFAVDYAINPWMDPPAWAGDADRLAQAARAGWRQLHDLYRSLGATIELQPAEPSLPDLVFTANAAVVLDGTALLARFRHPERQGEEAHDRRFFEGLKARGLIERVVETPDGMFFEGAGDAIWDETRRIFWFGHGQRSSAEARDVVVRTFGLPTLALKLVDMRFYHLDTCLCPLPGGEVLYVPAAFDEAGRTLLRDIVGTDRLIEVPETDAMLLAANATCLGGRNIVSGACGEELEAELARRGYAVHRVPLAAFARSGGSACCLTLRLDRRSPSTAAAGGSAETVVAAAVREAAAVVA
ncbi:MAG TPA: aminotransferase class III-fold pyridoxal phosphate-dependent enzyme, partial [Stellaceae bacterium]